jgi:dihydroceramide fatty acyl 2-hydroxylase
MASGKVQSFDTGEARTAGDHLRASPRLFQSPLLDKLSRVHWWVPLAFYSPFVVLLAWLSFTAIPPALVLFAMVCGYVSWTLVEYFGHRYLFHAEFPGTWGAHLHFLIHGVHHDHPNDPLRLVMPLLMSAPIMAIAYCVISLVSIRPLANPTMMGFMLGYLAYDTLHYCVHHIDLRTSVGRKLRRLHMLHHFHDAERGFGISAPWWDKVFGTGHREAQQSHRQANSSRD